MVYEIEVTTKRKDQMIDITDQIRILLSELGISNGICYVYVPHTTAGITINENADPDVVTDILMEMNKMIPWQDGYRHFEGNSAAHLKASLMGFSQTVLVDNGKLCLGTWQGIYFCEFDGPRHRKVLVKMIEG